MATETPAIEVVELTTFKIPEDNLSALTAKIAELSRKAEKLMGRPITLTVVQTFNEEITRNGVGTGHFRRYHQVTVNGPRPKLDGWEFVAALDVVTLDDGQQTTIVRTAPGKTIPAHIRDHGPTCDHCRTHRNRKTMYVVEKVA